MILGMTGFGSAEITTKKMKLVIEVRTLNHRYLDITYYLPTGFGSIEERIRQIVQKYLERGRTTVSMKIVEKTGHTIVLNKDIVKKHIHYANSLQKEFGLKNDLSLSDIIKLPGVLETKEVFVTAEELWPVLESGLGQCLKSVVAMRRREGRTLVSHVSQNLKLMASEGGKIRARSAVVLAEKKKILNDDEFKSFQKGCDIEEEISRLKHFIDEMKILFKDKAALSVGKKIDFIAQEMQRETNTMGSKLPDRIVSNAVIVLKSKVEQIREQAQNIE